MSEIVRKITGQKVSYVCYGGKGQSQYGIDLLPTVDFPVVGQCKLLESSFTWKMVLAELKKTDGYVNPIAHYFLLTTANPHTSIQDVLNQAPYFHFRPDGSKFQVHVVFWEHLNDLSFVPQDILRRIFPEAFQIAVPPSPAGVLDQNFLSALAAFKNCMPRFISMSDLDWLETWNFSCGYVPLERYNRFEHLYIEYDRVSTALKGGISEWLYQGGREELARALPAGERFFAELERFRNAINSQARGESLNGLEVYSILDYPLDSMIKITNTWSSSAKSLANVYRRDVLGEIDF